MNYEEAKTAIKTAGKLYRAYVYGRVWNAGRMVDVDETIGYYATQKEAREACANYKLFDFDREHTTTDVEEVFGEEFEA